MSSGGPSFPPAGVDDASGPPPPGRVVPPLSGRKTADLLLPGRDKVWWGPARQYRTVLAVEPVKGGLLDVTFVDGGLPEGRRTVTLAPDVLVLWVDREFAREIEGEVDW